jgi:hypothetical protein
MHKGESAPCSLPAQVFLIDLVSKLYFSTDSGPMHGGGDTAGYELASDAIDVLVDVALIFDPREASAALGGGGEEGKGVTSSGDVRVAGPCSTGIVRLRGTAGSGLTLYLREVASRLAGEPRRRRVVVNYKHPHGHTHTHTH